MRYANGNIYEGDWQNGSRNGYGVQKYANGDVYTGEWKDNLQHGTGFEYENGRLYSVVYNDGFQVQRQ